MKQKKRIDPVILLIKNRKGQFYLIAAMIIISLIIGFAAISNYIEKRETVKLYDLGEELKIESENVLDYGTYNEYNNTDMDELVRNFIDNYVGYIEGGIEVYFLFGNWEKITIVKYQEINYYGLVLDGEYSSTYIEEEIIENPEKDVVVNINENSYEFRLKPGENFYFVISQEIGEEQDVITG